VGGRRPGSRHRRVGIRRALRRSSLAPQARTTTAPFGTARLRVRDDPARRGPATTATRRGAARAKTSRSCHDRNRRILRRAVLRRAPGPGRVAIRSLTFVEGTHRSVTCRSCGCAPQHAPEGPRASHLMTSYATTSRWQPGSADERRARGLTALQAEQGAQPGLRDGGSADSTSYRPARGRADRPRRRAA